MKVAEVAAVAAPALPAPAEAAARAAVAGNFCDFYKKSKLTKSRSIKGRLFILR